MPARRKDQRKTKPPKKAALWPAILFSIAVVAWTTAMMVSLKWGFLDSLCKTGHGPIGLDFFQAPRGYNNLLIGNSIFATEIGDYGPYATPYLYHPVVALAVGPWTAPWAPWTAYAVFVGVSLGLLLLSAWLLASAFPSPAVRGFTYFAIFCSLPVYMMLWSGQAHVLLVVAVALILSGLMRREQEPQQAARYGRWIQLGLAISLLSKPIAVLMLPVLFVTAETRRKLLLPVAIYTVVSLLFLVVERLNPGGYNAIHWLNILQVSSAPVAVQSVVHPLELDLLKAPDFCSLPVLVDRIAGFPVPSLFFRIPLLAILVMSLSPLLLAEGGQRLRAAIVTVLLCILSHNLCYYPALAYHYTTLLPALPVLLWLWQRESRPRLRGLLVASFVLLLVIFLPTVSVPSPTESARWHDISTSQRVVPVLVAFLCLTVYGLESVWHQRRRPKLITREMVARLWPACGLAGALGIMLGSVAAAVYGTVPTRWLTTPSRWTKQDRMEHHQATILQLECALDATPHFGAAHSYLGYALLGQGRPDEVLAHYQRAVEIEPDSAEARYNLGRTFARLGRFDEAMAQYQKALEIKPDLAEAHHNLGQALANRGRIDEAMAQYQKALEIKPDYLEAHGSLGDLFAGQGNLDEAVRHYLAVLRLNPRDVRGHVQLGKVLRRQGKPQAAEVCFREALHGEPSNAEACSALAKALEQQGKLEEALGYYQESLRLRPDQPDILNNLAWIRATHPDPKFRDGAQAVAAAQHAVKLLRNEMSVVDTLAAAYAEAGRFPEALAAARKALDLATQRHDQRLANALRSRIRLYEAGKPYRQTLSASVLSAPLPPKP